MKEATGELNMTVVTVVAIAAVGAFFYAFVWPNIKNSIQANTFCSMAQCSGCTSSNGVTKCTTCEAYDDQGQETWKGQCTFKGDLPAGATVEE